MYVLAFSIVVVLKDSLSGGITNVLANLDITLKLERILCIYFQPLIPHPTDELLC